MPWFLTVLLTQSQMPRNSGFVFDCSCSIVLTYLHSAISRLQGAALAQSERGALCWVGQNGFDSADDAAVDQRLPRDSLLLLQEAHGCCCNKQRRSAR